MKFYATIAALVAAVAAQDLSQLPSCATSCALSGITATGCQVTDAKCVCTSSSFLASTNTCIQTACSPSDIQKTLQFAQSYCANAGVTITLPGSSSAPSSSAPASQSQSAPSASATTSMSSSSSKAVAAPTPTTPSNGTITTAAPTQFTGAAGAVQGSWIVAALGAVAAAAF